MFKTIVVALDGSEHSMAAISTAEGVADRGETEFVIVHVRQLTGGRGAGPVHLDEAQRAAAVHDSAELLRTRGFKVTEHAYSTFKRPADLILRVAKRHSADLVVTGLGKHYSLLGAAITATPYAVVHHAPCPVLVVRESIRPAQAVSKPEPALAA